MHWQLLANGSSLTVKFHTSYAWCSAGSPYRIHQAGGASVPLQWPGASYRHLDQCISPQRVIGHSPEGLERGVEQCNIPGWHQVQHYRWVLSPPCSMLHWTAQVGTCTVQLWASACNLVHHADRRSDAGPTSMQHTRVGDCQNCKFHNRRVLRRLHMTLSN